MIEFSFFDEGIKGFLDEVIKVIECIDFFLDCVSNFVGEQVMVLYELLEVFVIVMDDDFGIFQVVVVLFS